MTTFRTTRCAGFTLIELMVVLVVIAVMAGLLVIGIGDDPGRQLRREISALAAVLNIAADEAVAQGMELGLVIDDEHYHFVRFDRDRRRWQAIQGKPLARHEFAQPYEVELELDGEKVDERLRERLQRIARQGEKEDQPLLLLLSSGETAPFTLTVTHAGSNARVVLRGDGVNPVAVTNPVAAKRPAGNGA